MKRSGINNRAASFLIIHSNIYNCRSGRISGISALLPGLHLLLSTLLADIAATIDSLAGRDNI